MVGPGWWAWCMSSGRTGEELAELRKNIGENYHGCLVVGVLQSRDLYRHIEGVWRGICAGL